MQQFDPRISDFEDVLNYVNAHNVRDEEQEAIDREEVQQADAFAVCETEYLASMEN